MRRILLLFFAVCTIPSVVAQDTGGATLSAYNLQRERTTVAAMSVLAGWSAVNLVTGTTLWLTSDDPSWASFHQMNAGWNIVNAAIAAPALLSSLRALRSVDGEAAAPDLAASLRAQQRIERALLFNAGLDLAYVMAGLYLVERANRPDANTAQLTGWGWSLVLQGGFLFAFDLGAYAAQRRNAPILDRLLAGGAVSRP
jgi:hypothetical protein